MSCPVNTFNKSKEDFIWFVKKAVTDQKSYSHSELYHSLLKLFVDADTNKDGLVSRASFSKLIDAAAAMPRAYGYAPTDAELYKSGAVNELFKINCTSYLESDLRTILGRTIAQTARLLGKPNDINGISAKNVKS